MSPQRCAGLLARFADVEGVVAAARAVDAQGYRAVDAFTPFPIEELAEVLHTRTRGVQLGVLIGAILGGASGYLLQWYTAVRAFPFDIGGRQLHSWPAFLIVTFEMAVLGGALVGFFAMLALNGLPRLHHPVMGAECFQLASRDRFFLYVESRDRLFDAERTRALLESLQPQEVTEVWSDE